MEIENEVTSSNAFDLILNYVKSVPIVQFSSMKNVIFTG